MSRYELSISPDYVKDWDLSKAIREIFQNSLDQEIVNPSNKMSYTYEDNVLSISSKSSSLDKSTLLFGTSSKTDNEKTIGQFGEGYKLALLVLVREGYKVVIYNHKVKEVWSPKFVNSRRFNSQILVIDTKTYLFTNPPDNDLTFKILDIPQDKFDEVSSTMLFMGDSYNSFKTPHGEVLLDEKNARKIFINGLFVTKCNDMVIRYGYNIKPEFLRLDRDRSLVDSFDINWMTSQLWTRYTDKKFVADLIVNEFPDVKYLKNHMVTDSDLSNETFDSFSRKHGMLSMPVFNTQGLASAKLEYPKLKPIVVNENIFDTIQKSQNFVSFLDFNRSSIKPITPYDIMKSFLDNNKQTMDENLIDRFKGLIAQSKGWTL